MNKTSKIFVAGHNGMVGTALMKRLITEGYTNIVTRSHSELDLTRQSNVEDFFQRERNLNTFFLRQQKLEVWVL